MFYTIIIQQLINHVAIAVDDAEPMSFCLHQLDEVAEVMNMGWMININKYFHNLKKSVLNSSHEKRNYSHHLLFQGENIPDIV